MSFKREQFRRDWRGHLLTHMYTAHLVGCVESEKHIRHYRAAVAHAFNPSTRERERGRGR